MARSHIRYVSYIIRYINTLSPLLVGSRYSFSIHSKSRETSLNSYIRPNSHPLAVKPSANMRFTVKSIALVFSLLSTTQAALQCDGEFSQVCNGVVIDENDCLSACSCTSPENRINCRAFGACSAATMLQSCVVAGDCFCNSWIESDPWIWEAARVYC